MASDRGGRSVLDGALRVLRAVPSGPAQVSVSAIARRAGLPRPTTYRLLTQLTELGALTKGGGRYQVTAEFAELHRRTDPAAQLRQAAAGVLETLRSTTGASASLAVLDIDGPRLIRVLNGHRLMSFDVYDGMTLPLDCAAGIVLQPRRDPARLHAHGRAAVDVEHNIPGLRCYAARITTPVGTVNAALQLAELGGGDPSRFAPLLHQAAQDIATRLARGASDAVPLTWADLMPSRTGRAGPVRQAAG